MDIRETKNVNIQYFEPLKAHTYEPNVQLGYVNYAKRQLTAKL